MQQSRRHIGRAAQARRLLRARDFIDAQYEQPLVIAEIAQRANMSEAHFARQFRIAFGETPQQYLSSRRLERAAALLRNTDYSVARICMTVGFASVGSFTSAFGRVYGLTPTRYRRQHLPGLIARVIPPCVLQAVDRPQLSRMGEDRPANPPVRSHPVGSITGERDDTADSQRDVVGARPG